MIDAAKGALQVDVVVVASPHPLSLKTGIPNFIGSEDNVLERYYECAHKYKADVIVRLTADCPLLESSVIDIALRFFFTHQWLGYVCFAPVDGMDVEVFDKEMLEVAYLEAIGEYDKEHVTPWMKRFTKISVDTEEEYKKVKIYYELHR